MAPTNPRIPCDEEEVFAMAWLIGYMGNAPAELVEAFPDVWDWHRCPDFVSDDLAYQWRNGYDNGVTFYSDHADTRRGRKQHAYKR